MRFLRHSLVGLFLLSLTAGLLVYAGHLVTQAVQDSMSREPPARERRERVFAVNVETAQERTVTPVLSAFGEIRSRRTLEIRARVGGALVELARGFEDGGEVSKGQLLARVDPADAKAALDRARTDLMDARAETREAERALELAKDELAAARDQQDLRERAYKRQKDLQDRGVGTQASVETAELAAAQARQAVLSRRQAVAQAEARVDQAETRLARARIDVAEAERRLADTRITAGFDGTLSDVSVVEGGLVSPNERLGRLVDPDALEVAFRVSTGRYARLLGDDGTLIDAPVTVTLDVDGVELVARGTLSRDSAAVGEGQTGRRLYARLDRAPGFKPGDFVKVEIDEPELSNVVRLPSSALGPDGDVLVLGSENRLESVQVELLRRQGDDILVRATALDGREVVTKRSPLLGAGVKVRPLRQDHGAARAREGGEAAMLDLSAERRARLVDFIRRSPEMPEDVKARLLAQLEQRRVPARMVRRLEGRMGG
ncbi:efflux RND transporter periplasmic adaptor subunit [Roseovarius salinarum]|uniref:efflux RND transporter periplasmic adaptor subunit n=1 Tax=Roseovarius salinarum TaxID=1981892 RepID=UPI000C326ECD|nr:efflux RND transporter periplasmic adaptor subunit [Roseovarius salinarum]